MKKFWKLFQLNSPFIFAGATLPFWFEEKSLERNEKKLKGLIQSQLDLNRTKLSFPGISCGVSLHEKRENATTIVKHYSFGSGYKNLESGERCSSSDVCRIASISKPLTAFLLGILEEGEVLSLDDSIHKYIDEETFPKKEKDITIRQLLSHTGGIRHYKRFSDEKTIENEEDRSILLEKLIHRHEFYSNRQFYESKNSLELFKNDDLIKSEDGEGSYSTYGYTLLTQVINEAIRISLEKCGEKKKKKEDYFNLIMNELFDVLQMKYTSFDYPFYLQDNRMQYYQYVPQQYKSIFIPHLPNGNRRWRMNSQNVFMNAPPINNSNKWAGGGIVSNVNDLLTFSDILLLVISNRLDVEQFPLNSSPLFRKLGIRQSQIFKKNSILNEWKPITSLHQFRTNYGLGWASSPRIKMDNCQLDTKEYDKFVDRVENGKNYIFHSGGSVGSTSLLLIIPNALQFDHSTIDITLSLLCNVEGGNGIVSFGFILIEQIIDLVKQLH
ncbi:hypothetical protein SNEBB_008698 [Seison nebaliae]|nr:hypothetical protein SNEBB_008698 [Seison nebaliae]